MTATETREPAAPTRPGELDLDTVPLRPPWPWRRVVLAAIAVTLVALTWWGFGRTGFSIGAVIDGWADMRRLIDRMLPIRFDDLDRTVELAIETFFIAFVGTALAITLSIPIAFMAARNTTVHRFAFGTARGFIVMMRAIPDLVFALIFVRAIGLGGVGGIVAGILAIGLNSIGMVGKLYADAIEQIDEGPREAVLSTGATRNQAIVTGALPQVLPAFIGVGLYRLDINFRTSTVLGYVGAGGIGQLLQLYLSGLRYDRALGVTVVIVVLVLAVEFLSAAVRKSILGGVDPYAERRLTRRLGRGIRRVLGRGRVDEVPIPVVGAAPAHHHSDEVELVDPEAARLLDLSDRVDPNAAVPLPFDRETLRPPWTPQRRRMAFYSGLALVTLVVSFWSTGVKPWDLLTSFGDILSVSTRLIPTSFDWFTPDLRAGLIETLAMALVSTFIGLTMAIPLAFLAARNVAPARWIYAAARTIVVVVRAIPELILAVLFVAALGLGPFPGVLALSIGTIGFATKLFADSIEEVRQGPRDAIDATGATRLQESFTGVLPQAMPAIIGTSLYILDINIRASTILGIVGAGGIGFYLIQATRTLNWETVGGIILMVFVTVYLIERLSGWVRKQLI
ncbi:MAG TPA: phosphonate ABC transporter, permease protein PhnE [Acidimicrobiales bacterium]|nr:phosphonate ABC transporter, permease protein PhnE [Acidimicrobiales bacterium]